MTPPIKFGTDGWRGRIADDYTFGSVRRCAQGFARYLLEQGYRDEWVVVGHDKRFASEDFAAATAEVLVGNGLRVWLTNGATPTPVIAYAVRDRSAVGAVNITASHNPPHDNGFKVRDSNGGAIAPEGLKRIEAAIPDEAGQVQSMSTAEAKGRDFIRMFDAAPAYKEHLLDLIDLQPIKEAGLTVLVDAMWGNGAGWFSDLLTGGRTRVIEIHNQRNPSFPDMSRPEPIPPNVDAGLAAARAQGADVLIVTDGDADRLGLGDEHGRFVDQLRVYALLALYLLEVRGLRGPIVKTLSTTSMLEKLGALYNVPVHQTGVGFKYVAPKMLETNALIGGEESGGYAFRDHVPERDGILSGLYILDMMCRLDRKPSQLVDLLFSKVGPHYYDRIDRSFDGAQREAVKQRILDAHPAAIGGLPMVGLNTTDGFKFDLEGGAWLLIRFSGTEPIIRVYCEVHRPDEVQPVLEDGLKLAGV